MSTEPAVRLVNDTTEVFENQKPRARHDCKIVNLATVDPEAIKWLWPGRFPLGMYSLLAGQPSAGKSTIAFSIAAIVTVGGKWPFTEHRASPGRVIILTAEDDPKYTLVPRLMAAGADLTKIEVIQSVARIRDDHVIDAPLLLSEDMGQLDGVLTQYPDTKLLIIDPLSAYLGVKDSHRDADVRQVLGPLTDLAARHEVAILGITHLSKAATNSAMARFIGSTGIVAAARAAFLATELEGERMLLPVKSNVAPDRNGGLIYRIVTRIIAGDIETSAVEWCGQTDIGADEALAQQAAKTSSPKKNDAIEFLREQLRQGPKQLDDIAEAAEAQGIAWATVRRAHDELGIKSIREKKFQSKFIWHTPEQAASVQPEEQGSK